jgi:hypothetical protein
MKIIILTIVRTLIIFTICLPSFAQQTVKFSTKEEIAADIKLAPCKNGDRLDAVRKLFLAMGAAEADIVSDKVKGMQNLVVTKKGKTDETVVIGAHYDKVADGCGAIDNWTGIVIIAHIYRLLRPGETNKTYVFVAFDSEESGLLGSAAFVRNIPKEKKSGYCSMVNFDSFGFGYPNILSNASNDKMIKSAKEVAAEVKMPLNVWSFNGADADSSSFQNNGIPAITLDGLDSKWPRILHSDKDKVELINASSVFVGYNFGLKFLAKIESEDCAAFRKK